MGLSQAIVEALNKRGNTFIVKIKQDLSAAGKSATGSLIKGTRGTTRVVGSTIIFEASAPEHYIFVDKGRKPNSKMPPIRPIMKWIKRRGLDLNPFAVAKSIAKKGIKPTRIYTKAIERFKRDKFFGKEVKEEIINELKK